MKYFKVHPPLALALLLVGSSLPAFGTSIVFTCAGNIDATFAGTCATLNGTIAGLYASAFTNVNAAVYIQYGSTGLGSSTQYINTVSYSDFYAALVAGQSGANDATAIASLGGSPTVNPVVNGQGIGITSALGQTLGLSGYSGIRTDSTSCTVGSANCYNALITIADNQPLFYRSGIQGAGEYDFYSVVEHEFNEVLGTPSCLTTVSGAPGVSCNFPTNGTGPADLFRNSAPGVRSYLGPGGNQANGTLAYLSIDGGVTSIAEYNNSPNGEDYGDFGNAAVRVQNAEATPGASVDNAAPELALLDAIGYTRTSVSNTPEPGTIALFGSSFAVLAGLARRRRKL